MAQLGSQTAQEGVIVIKRSVFDDAADRLAVTRLESSRRDAEYTQSAAIHLDGAFSAEAAVAQLGSQTAQEGEVVIKRSLFAARWIGPSPPTR